MSVPLDQGSAPPRSNHWFYDSKILVMGFCLMSLMAIFWQVSRFEGFEPIFTCRDARDVDTLVLSEGMSACMANARSQPEQQGCMRTVYILACMKEQWR